MKKQKQYREVSQSRKRVQSVFQEEEAVSKAFELKNFYTNQRLNIGQLKQRLQKFKRNQGQSSAFENDVQNRQKFTQFNNFPSIEGNRHSSNGPEKGNAMNNSYFTPQAQEDSKNTNKKVSYNQNKQLQNFLNSKDYETQKMASRQFDGNYNIQKKQQIKSVNYRIVKEINKYRYDNKTKTSYGLRQNIKQQPQSNKNTIHAYFTRDNKNKSNGHEKTENSRTSSRSHNYSMLEQLHIEGRIVIEQKNQLNELEKHIHVLWQHYQLLTKILLGLKQGKHQQKNAIVKYVEDICSDKFQFVRDIILAIKKENSSKTQQSFMKRLKKTIILSRLYENLSVLYVSLDICFRKLPDSHLVNYVGYCSSNVIFLLKFTSLVHSISQSLSFSQNTLNILAVIQQFQMQSYKNQITKIGDLILRMQHNNETIAILQNRLCNTINKEFQDTIHKFIKNVDIETKILFQYGHYIFQYLAYYLASIKVVGQFSFIQIAPSPYFHLPKKRTLVIEPWEVLFAFKDNNTYLRAYSQQFLTEIGKQWNIVYWTDLMPDKIDDLIQKLPFGKKLYQYHCRYENQRFLKLLWRIGSDPENTIIIDRQQPNYKYDKQMGMQLPWKGKGKDTRLLQILNALIPLINSDEQIPLRKSFPQVKQQMNGSLMKSRNKRVESKGNEYNQVSNYPKNLKLPKNNRFKYNQQ